MAIPTKNECLAVLHKNKTPSNVIGHSKKVCRVAEAISNKLIKKGIKINKGLVIAAALLHDIERAKSSHAAKGAKLLKKLGFREVSEAAGKHSLHNFWLKKNRPKTYEEKIVFYSDKRVRKNKIVSLEERFRALEKEYRVNLSKELCFAKKIEKELL